MHPSLGEMLEISWCVSTANLEQAEVKTRLLKVDSIPSRVREVTGITNSDLVDAHDPSEVRSELLHDIEAGGFECAVIHYAQFERAFLLDFLELDELPFKVLCTHAISKRLIPNVPSRNIRALSGYFGSHFAEVKRSSEHLQATLQIWRGLVSELEKNELSDLGAIELWLQNVKAKKPLKYEYNIDKEWRLGLPKRPGVYRMLSKNGEILYVGKATSLRDRVNSYFRGMRGREKRKLEMMTQAWKIEVTECESALEAALLESDEIKKHNPPYNVALKVGNQALVYYSRDFSSKSELLTDEHFVGPFRRWSAIDELLTICRYRRDGDPRGVFYDLLSPSEISDGLHEFARRWPEAKPSLTIRRQLALGFKILRKNRSAVEAVEEELSLETEDESETLSPEEVAGKFERAYMRAAYALLRSRRMTRLLNCEVRWHEAKAWRSIKVAGGKICSERELTQHTPFSTKAWQELGMIDYDRMSVLDTALQKVLHEFS